MRMGGAAAKLVEDMRAQSNASASTEAPEINS